MSSLFEIGLVVLKKKIFKVRQCIFAISLLSPLRKGRGPIFEQTWILITQNAVCQVWLKLALWFLRGRFLRFVNVFSIFPYDLPLEKGVALPWTNLNLHHPRLLCAKFGWNWPSGSGEEDENVKSLQTDGQTEGRTDGRTTDNRRSEKLTWAFSSDELITNFSQQILLLLVVLILISYMYTEMEYLSLFR